MAVPLFQGGARKPRRRPACRHSWLVPGNRARESPGVSLPDNAGSAVPRDGCERERPNDLVRHAVASLTVRRSGFHSRKGSMTDRDGSRRESTRERERKRECVLAARSPCPLLLLDNTPGPRLTPDIRLFCFK